MNENDDYIWVQKIKHTDFNLREKNPHVLNHALQQYLSFYHFQIELIDEYRCGFEKVNEKKLFIQFFLRQQAKGVVYLVHGYLDHSGGLSKTVNTLLQNNYQVVVLDLPGHGFSNGEKGMITSFEHYVDAVEVGYKMIKRYLADDRVYALGHSTGAAILFHALAEEKIETEGLLLVAPLYLPFQWSLLKRLLFFSGKLFPQKKRGFKRNSNDVMYRQFVKHDPLQVKVLKAQWIEALSEWQMQFTDCPLVDRPVYILQGTKDTTVDWRKNIRFYQTKCKDFQVALFHRARHQLLNEHREIRLHVYRQLNSFLDSLHNA
ncbi:alpha/beta fold hydrolase [Evansella cellulosilytica]|uniref:Alpha/beta hydrolase fold protein n=1 Tax=Evansella cellulosilytica (strain ATCC 21833 / DSM 2522 / FERM P-1141 / JCM 9156 / N-4) TaxID=649639 RepID=E6U264_EVAC2|nr:alpha/beta fold hydrolase [Evansella cellulosilytica]ADU30442.1 alpha/beta hydrolase fold protein [Evansella cellulosilytica DSM 2522]